MASTTARGYGHQHQQRRKVWARKVAKGDVACARCGGLIVPGSKWHLDHTDDRSGYLGPSHAGCNMAAGAAKTNGRYLPGYSVPVDQMFASRHWYPADGYDPK